MSAWKVARRHPVWFFSRQSDPCALSRQYIHGPSDHVRNKREETYNRCSDPNCSAELVSGAELTRFSSFPPCFEVCVKASSMYAGLHEPVSNLLLVLATSTARPFDVFFFCFCAGYGSSRSPQSESYSPVSSSAGGGGGGQNGSYTPVRVSFAFTEGGDCQR